ncbi:class I SAM-dependent methyltransferase [Cytobacillus sp. IB215665]|uniref:class I SAM-dependent methyltransferase n=1 Tax=Cytobacillus sp. IB215665 TaxID=3097357 RepID=UPI002A0AB1AE|nr:methyltransferase domain-containing protein [Cytobacillus sp. IB215665]MDX8367080.1 methyltransferase domain-containing protein [Cytobacillus sp. IB215665]
MSKHKNNIFEDNMEKYRDPEYYDLQFEHYMKDLPLLLEWAEKQQGTIVDLACGTGRITIPLAKRGFSMIGIDINEGMLKRAKEKTNDTKFSIQWMMQDCTKLSLENNSSFMYMTGNSFQHFLTNDSQDQLLTSVHSNLSKQGIFIFGTRYPNVREWDDKAEKKTTYIDKRNRSVVEYRSESYHSLTQVLHCKSRREIINNDGGVITTEKDSISLRFVFPLEMERLLNQHGFTIIDEYGSWDQTPLNESSQEMIYVCKKV